MYFGDDIVVLTDMHTPLIYNDITIWGLPFEPLDGAGVLNKLHSLKGCMSSDKKNILLFHGELIDAFFSRRDFGHEGEERYMPVRLSYFNDLNIDYVLAGHFHSRFDVRELKHGRYFVYPGSPVSITRKETGQRRVNIFKPGSPPVEYLLDTPHFEDLTIELDPFGSRSPVDIVKEKVEGVNPVARIILTVKGFINCKALKMGEAQIVQRIRDVCAERCVEEHYEFKDLHAILEDDLLKAFLKKLEQRDYDEDQKKRLRDMAVRAAMGI
ncbi:DNA repair exonuclease, partial [bacterium]|nr:DNA repair exonuclease [bacterium]